MRCAMGLFCRLATPSLTPPYALKFWNTVRDLQRVVQEMWRVLKPVDMLW